MRVLLMGGVETRFHRFDELRPSLERTLQEAGHACTSLEAHAALRADVLRGVDAVVSVTTAGELTNRQESALLGAVSERRNDRGQCVHFLGVHGASCSFDNSPAYFEMLGGRFSGHPPMADIQVRIERPEHAVTRGVDDFVIHDELYLLEPRAPFQRLLSAPNPVLDALVAGTRRRYQPTQAALPLGWVHRFGEGKVCYLALGHGREQLEHPSLKRLMTQALDWFGQGD